MNLVQIVHPQAGRKLARVSGDKLAVLRSFQSLYALARRADREAVAMEILVERDGTEQVLDYDPIYALQSDWRLLAPYDHPTEPARCFVTGTGLTHLASASDRDEMHVKKSGSLSGESDSLRMYRWGVEGGSPPAGSVGVAPEWFYKGTGRDVRAHGEPLEIPAFAESGGEEPELVGLYLIGHGGCVRRIGFCTGNEFSDHAFEKRNYLYLAHSKLRTCSLGPEAVVGVEYPDQVAGRVTIERAGSVLWERDIETGRSRMSHSLANLEHHHFKYDAHRQEGDAHVHFFGAAGLSFSAGIRMTAGDVTSVQWAGFGRPLRNPIRVQPGNPHQCVTVTAL